MTIISTGSCQNLCPNWTAVPLKTQPPTRQPPQPPNIFFLLWPLQLNSLHLRGQKSRRKKRGESCCRFDLFGIKPQLSCFFLMPPLKTWCIASILGHFLPFSSQEVLPHRSPAISREKKSEASAQPKASDTRPEWLRKPPLPHHSQQGGSEARHTELCEAHWGRGEEPNRNQPNFARKHILVKF